MHGLQHEHSITNTLTTLQCHSKGDMHTRGSTTTSVAHPCKGNITIWCKHLIGLSTTVKASTRTEGHDHNLVVAAEEQEQASTQKSHEIHVTTQDTNPDTLQEDASRADCHHTPQPLHASTCCVHVCTRTVTTQMLGQRTLAPPTTHFAPPTVT